MVWLKLYNYTVCSCEQYEWHFTYTLAHIHNFTQTGSQAHTVCALIFVGFIFRGFAIFEEDPFAVAVKRGTKTVGHIPCTVSCVWLYAIPAAACVRILWSYREQQTERRLVAILVTHDVIDWLQLCIYVSIYSDVQIFADEIFADG